MDHAEQSRRNPAHLLPQTEARAEARRLNMNDEVPEGMVAIAGAWPINSWGGAEKGWTVYYVPMPS